MIYQVGKHEIELYDSIDNLPILRFQKFNKYQMISAEVGNTFQDYENRTVKALQFIRKGMPEEAAKELENRRQTVFNAFNEFTPKGKAFAILVRRIDNYHYTGYAPDDLDRCLAHLDRIGLGHDASLEKLNEVKKKIETELVVYFPDYFPKNGNKEQTALRLRRTNVLLDNIINPSPKNDKLLFDIEKEILEHDKPNTWNVWVKGNMERVLEVDFQKFAIAVTENSTEKLSEMTVKTFYATVELIKERKPKK